MTRSASAHEIRETRKAIYAFCHNLAFKLLGSADVRLPLRLLLEPLNYWRNIEVPAAVNELRLHASDRVLDIGSPKIASLFIWRHYRCIVHSTDISDYFLDEYAAYRRGLNGASPGTFTMQLEDARHLTFPDESFDKVYSISVLEHIADAGDTAAMREIHRVLRVGGICCVTVPYARRYRESFTTRESYYIKGRADQPAFYERHYDDQALHERLIGPSGLRLLRIQYFGERGLDYERWYDRLPYVLKVGLAPFSRLATRLFITPVATENREHARTAIVTLTKVAPGPSTPLAG